MSDIAFDLLADQRDDLKAEIERLTRERDEARAAAGQLGFKLGCAEADRDRLARENETLRAALEKVEERAGDMSDTSTSRCGDIGRIVRAALKEKARSPQ